MDIKDFIEAHLQDDPTQLMLQASRYPDIPMAYVVTQIQGRQKAKEKLPSWYDNTALEYPVKLSMEQCSSEATGLYKASLIKGKQGIDLTGGFGVDTYFFSQKFESFAYVERQEELAELVKKNMEVLDVGNVNIHAQDGVTYLKNISERVDFIYLDPARRDEFNEKVVRIEECEPNIKELQDSLVEKGKEVMIKLSPMLDIKQTIQTIPYIREVQVVSVQNECKEILLLLSKELPEEPAIVSINISKDGRNLQRFSFLYSEEEYAASTYAEKAETYIYEPNVAILKAGGYKTIGNQYGLKKLHPNSHLYTSETLIEDFPGRIFECVQQFGFGKKEIKKHLSMKKANITVRNFPLTVAQIRKKTGLQDGGEVYLFATTDIKNQKTILKCIKSKR
ncbi:THUMP-like domain-containing protein [Algivirga pacifica]|uniref:SAM-dependent methyltransferase n=1 Tax=Algivirga pacifica TaxID=1162670 RepID=A0ABP9D650_9BACT